ncbi:pentatricopeptide repeat-containing protein At4g20770 [Mercurialis annua]|uniref:pentatricopeptide repeat-containing protein At4g20770 n=1 Tax=Mercurialis annua TaxID=3986 RepID=UPI002160BC90|nr:pentatricopeptide repeat-containing protein At4g20770 [Mercurialis annua]
MERKASQYVATLLQSCIDKKAHSFGKLLHAHILRVGLSAETFLMNRLIELYFKAKNFGYAHKVFDKMPQRNIFSWNAVLTEYCKSGSLGDAHKLFAEMPERNTVSWNNLISALSRGGLYGETLVVYDEMILEGLMPTRFTLASVLSACGALLDAECGKRCHSVSVKIGLDMNVYVSNALLSVYAKCGLLRYAVGLFEEMEEPNEVTFTALMGGFMQTDRVLDALEMFRLMSRRGICIDSVSLSSVLSVCTRGGCRESGFYDQSDGFLRNALGRLVHGLAIKLGSDNDLHFFNSLLDMYAKSGDMDSAEEVFSNLPEVSVVSWNVMIAGYGQKCKIDKAIEYWHRMQSSGFDPDEVTHINMLAACIKSGDMEIGRQIFDSMALPNVSSWNAILSGYIQVGNHKEAIELFQEMQFRNVKPDRTTIAIILSSCAGMELLEAGKQVHAVSLKASFHNDIYVASGLIGMYSKCRKMDIAEFVFQKMPELDSVCWNSIIAGFTLNSLDKEALTCFKQMRENGMSPTHFSYATILSCCAKLSSLFHGKLIHAQLEKEGFSNDVYVGTSLVDMYCKCGEVDEARQFFDLMPKKNSVTWNEMIHGYAQNGRGCEAIDLYKNMIELGEKPDEITFVAVLTACSHSGLVDTGVEIFESMHQAHGVDPILDHYTCMIDALARAGRFDEAEVLMDKMPCKDDPIVWEVLLSSCRLHGNVRLAKKVAEELIRLDPQNSSPYVLLANIYTSLGRWDDVRAIREQMSDKQVVKEAGYSWIEHKKGMESYIMEDDLKMVDLALESG